MHTPKKRIFCSRRWSDRISSVTYEFILLQQVINLLWEENIFYWVWFSTCTEDNSSCTKDSVQFKIGLLRTLVQKIFLCEILIFYNIFAGRRYISADKRLLFYWRRYSFQPEIINLERMNSSSYTRYSCAAEEFFKIFFCHYILCYRRILKDK
jgi:hypothetical protein